MLFTLKQSTEKGVRRCTSLSPKFGREHLRSLRPVTPMRDQKMTFKHKLSKRLAIIWEAAALFTALVLFACAGDQPIVAPTQPGADTIHPRISTGAVAPIDTTVLLQNILPTPGTVTDLAVAGVTDSAATLSFTEVSDGTGLLAANYLVRFAVGPIAWGSANDVKLGSCQVPLLGSTIGAKRSCVVQGLAPSTSYQFQLVAFSGTLNVDAVFGGLSNVVNGTTAANGTPAKPGTVSDLSVEGVTDTSATLSFIEVADGAGSPARYEVRFALAPIAWGSAASVTRGSCAVPLIGTTIGAKRTCQVLGLSTSTSYQFQLVAFRGTLNVDAVFGDLSNVASATTAARIMPVASVTLTPATASVTVGSTQQLTATLKDSTGAALSGRTITWASSNSAAATVSASGLVTGIAGGTATISATSETVQGTAAVTVTNPARDRDRPRTEWHERYLGDFDLHGGV